MPPIVIGVTGGVGTGKSTIARMFEELGAVVLDADCINHRLMEPKRWVWRRIVKEFGLEILKPDQTINRAKLGRLVFSDEARRKKLEEIVHPKVMKEIMQQLSRLRRSKCLKVVVLDIPLLMEAGATHLVDRVVVVSAPSTVQRSRLQQKYGYSEEEMSNRIAAQWDLSAKVALADDIIDNSNGMEATRTQVKRIWNLLQASNR